MRSPGRLTPAVATLLAALTLVAALAVLGAAPSTAATAPVAQRDDPEPASVVDRAGRLLAGEAAGRTDLTIALRDLFLARPRLGFLESLRADALLARPTDGMRDPNGDGYRGRSRRICDEHFCVHYARRGSDAPESRRWVRRTLRTLERVWDYEIGTLGMRPPPRDGRLGGDARFDVYLSELGARGLFGYCTPERRVRGERFAASGYCVLDDDFAREQYAAAPRASLRVTAAHEFFHAIQFGYDFREDPWLLESTATWVEERIADSANDNRRYLGFGAVRRPERSLDLYSTTTYAQYGNWAFWEFLTERHGADLVRDVWARADARAGAPNDSSVEALGHVLARRGGLTRAFTRFTLANLDPATAYDEGGAWPAARTPRAVRVRRGDRSTLTLRADHLAARHLVVRPVGDRRRGRLRVGVAGPGTPGAVVAVTVRRADGTTTRRLVRWGRGHRGALVVPFAGRRVDAVVVSAINASTRYRCGQTTLFACGGVPRDEGRSFEVTLRAR